MERGYLIRAVTNSKPGASFWRQDFPFGTPDVDYQTTDPAEQVAWLFAGIPPLGDNSQYGSVAGIFGTIGSDGYANSEYSFRSALVLTN